MHIRYPRTPSLSFDSMVTLLDFAQNIFLRPLFGPFAEL